MARCPICGGDRFQSMTRAIARQIKAGLVSEQAAQRRQSICSGCGSRPRHRLMFATLQTLDLLRPEKQVLHIAAEPALLPRFKAIYGESYTVANLSMEAMAALQDVNKVTFDMCRPTTLHARYDVVIHSHVLEHVHCNWALALMRVNTLLTEGGVHIFCIPVHEQGYYKEDLDPNLPLAVRIDEFGKDDHVRKFFKHAFLEEIQELCRLTGFDLRLAYDVLGNEAARRIRGSGQVFILQRSDAQSLAV